MGARFSMPSIPASASTPSPSPFKFPSDRKTSFAESSNLVEMKSIIWEDESIGAEYVVGQIPADLQEESEAFHTQLVAKPSPKTAATYKFWKAKQFRRMS